jgi:hypothetical protein
VAHRQILWHEELALADIGKAAVRRSLDDARDAVGIFTADAPRFVDALLERELVSKAHCFVTHESKLINSVSLECARLLSAAR